MAPSLETEALSVEHSCNLAARQAVLVSELAGAGAVGLLHLLLGQLLLMACHPYGGAPYRPYAASPAELAAHQPAPRAAAVGASSDTGAPAHPLAGSAGRPSGTHIEPSGSQQVHVGMVSPAAGSPGTPFRVQRFFVFFTCGLFHAPRCRWQRE